MITHTGTLHQFLFPSMIWRMPSNGIYLTFDDGPHPVATPEVLSVLQSHKAVATFFLTGQHISGRESLVREIASEGHTLGIHGFNHSRLPAFSRTSTQQEIIRTENLIRNCTSAVKKIYRPPFGLFSWNTVSAARSLGYQLVMWTVLTGDFRSWSTSKILSTALKGLSGGSILVFHDNDLTQRKIGPIVSECLDRIQDLGYSVQAM